MAKKDTKKGNKKGGNIKPIEEMIETQDSNAEKFLDKLEKLEGSAKENQQMVEQMDEQTVEPIETPIDKEIVKPIVEDDNTHQMMKILNSNIKGAIIYNKNRSTKGVNGEQYKSIMKGYKQAIGVEMDKEKADYIKKLNYEQAKSIIHTINVFNKKFNSKKVLAEATN